MNPPFGVSRPPRGNEACPDDFRFCYLGPAGTFTPLHRDVYGSYSWSANVVGRKMWWFFPPDRLDRVKVDGELVFDVRELEGEGGVIKVVQEVRCSLSQPRSSAVVLLILDNRKGRSYLSPVDGTIKS